MSMKYKDGYKYQLVEDVSFQTSFRPAEDIITDYLDLSIAGFLTIKKGYSWDGPSGPTFDTTTFMKGSCLHDGLYQLMRMTALPWKDWRKADNELKRQCLTDGMWKIRTKWGMAGLKAAGGSAAKPSSTKPIRRAP